MLQDTSLIRLQFDKTVRGYKGTILQKSASVRNTRLVARSSA